MQIAIVDDRAEDREELSACLENYMKKHQLDYTLTEFEDGENFLKAAAQVNFQLVFMDIYMENMDGIETARRLRQKNRLCKIVFLTITEDYARMGYSLSASYYLLKPLSLHQECRNSCVPCGKEPSRPVAAHSSSPTRFVAYSLPQDCWQWLLCVPASKPPPLSSPHPAQ